MGATTKFAHPYPANTDLVSQGAAAIQALAEDVETTEKDIAGVYRSLLHVNQQAGVDTVAGTYVLRETSGGGSLLPTGSASTLQVPTLYIDDADYLLSGLTAKLRLRAQVLTNATQPTITFTFGLYPVTVAGAADNLTFTLGTVVSGSTVAIASPAASTPVSGVGTDFNVPADGQYVLGVVTSGTLTNNNLSQLSAQLQLHHT